MLRWRVFSRRCEGPMALLLENRRRNPFHTIRRVLVERLERRDLLASYTTPEDSLLSVADAGLAGAFIQHGPEHGKLTLTNAGGFVYAPYLNYNGLDRFVYTTANTTLGSTAGE